jgi:hypothetical protein
MDISIKSEAPNVKLGHLPKLNTFFYNDSLFICTGQRVGDTILCLNTCTGNVVGLPKDHKVRPVDSNLRVFNMFTGDASGGPVARAEFAFGKWGIPK